MAAAIETAMVLAAGLGTRMRPITDTIPKPLVKIAGRSLLDRGLDLLAAAGVKRAVVNIHWLGGQVIEHAKSRRDIEIVISDERGGLLDSAGGIVKALPELGTRPFFILNADSFWIDRGIPALQRMAESWDDAAMDLMLLLAPVEDTTGHTGSTDFLMDSTGRLVRAKGAPQGHVYGGAGIIHPRIFAGARAEPHSLNLYFDRAIAGGRLYGHILDGHWITAGTPGAIAEADAAVALHGETAVQ